jgi:hypothetical protein
MTRFFLRSFLMLLAGLLAACSSFDQRWKDAGSGKDGMTRWDGQWKSGKNIYLDGAHHHGRLRCVLAPLADKKLNAYFHANWLMFSGNFDVMLLPVKAGPRRQNAREFEGTHELPAAFGGVYHYRATIVGDHLKSDYSCSIDEGIFELTRVR